MVPKVDKTARNAGLRVQGKLENAGLNFSPQRHSDCDADLRQVSKKVSTSSLRSYLMIFNKSP
jgi:hypothetical protein